MVFSIILLATSLSLDAFGVGAVYGLRRIKIPIISKLIICFFSILYAGTALIIGGSLSRAIPPEAAKIVGVAILFIMGIYIMIQGFLRNDSRASEYEEIKPVEKTLLEIAIKSLGITIQVIKNPIEMDMDKSGVIDARESLLLGLALSVDAIGVGIGSALAGFSTIAIPFAIGLFQLFFLYTGTYLGEKFSLTGKVNKRLFSILPGILLILLAAVRVY